MPPRVLRWLRVGCPPVQLLTEGVHLPPVTTVANAGISPGTAGLPQLPGPMTANDTNIGSTFCLADREYPVLLWLQSSQIKVNTRHYITCRRFITVLGVSFPPVGPEGQSKFFPIICPRTGSWSDSASGVSFFLRFSKGSPTHST